jgi:hypothetical protein
MAADKPSAWAMGRAETIVDGHADRLGMWQGVPLIHDIAITLDAARAEGRREGLEEAANVCDARETGHRATMDAEDARHNYQSTANEHTRAIEAMDCAEAIRALADSLPGVGKE